MLILSYYLNQVMDTVIKTSYMNRGECGERGYQQGRIQNLLDGKQVMVNFSTFHVAARSRYEDALSVFSLAKRRLLSHVTVFENDTILVKHILCSSNSLEDNWGQFRVYDKIAQGGRKFTPSLSVAVYHNSSELVVQNNVRMDCTVREGLSLLCRLHSVTIGVGHTNPMRYSVDGTLVSREA